MNARPEALLPKHLLAIREMIDRQHDDLTEWLQAVCHHPSTEVVTTIPGGAKSLVCQFCGKTVHVYPITVVESQVPVAENGSRAQEGGLNHD